MQNLSCLVNEAPAGTLVLLRNSAMDGRKGGELGMRYHGPFEIVKDYGKGFSSCAIPQQVIYSRKLKMLAV